MTRRARPAVVLAVVLLGGCGSATNLIPAPGQSLPVAPYGAKAPLSPAQLLAGSSQARPGRSDDLLTRSQERSGDEFDPPPPTDRHRDP